MSVKPRNGEKGQVAILSFNAKNDAYSRSLFPALREAGAEVKEGSSSKRWLEENRNSFNCVHINWPHLLYSAYSNNIYRILRRFTRFIVIILILRHWGVPIYWTAHNLYPHEPSKIYGLDWLARKIIIAVSRKVFVHGHTAAGILVEEFPVVTQKLVVIDHGHWMDLYPRGCSPNDARKRFELDEDTYVFLFIGYCREYKNLHGLLEAFEKIDGKAKLIIAGTFLSQTYYERIRAMIENNLSGRVVLRAELVKDEDIQYFLAAANAVVLPYTDILTSGAALLALSFGRPVVAPRKGHLVDLVNDNCGILYKIDDKEALLSSMRAVMRRKFDEIQIMEAALSHDWRETARRMLDTMRIR